MKPLLIAFTMLASLFTKTSFAAEEKVTPVVLQAFQRAFNVANVEWTIGKTLYKATFQLDGTAITAFYDKEGVLVATTRNITLHQAPITLQIALKKNYPNLWITEFIEVSNDEGTHYYVTTENADTKLILKSYGADGWSTYNRFRK